MTLIVAGRRRDTRRHPSQEEEPEWFTGGPSSQSDTIELIGFEVAEEQRAKREAAERKALADSRNSTLYVTLPSFALIHVAGCPAILAFLIFLVFQKFLLTVFDLISEHALISEPPPFFFI